MRYFAGSAGVCTAATGGSAHCYRIEFPDGTVHEFHDFSGGSSAKDWRLTRMEDQYGHVVAFDYSTANEWQISDSHERNHRSAPHQAEAP